MNTMMKLAAPLTALALLSAPGFAQTTETNTTTTVETADIAGPVTAEDLAENVAVMATTGEVVGKVVSIVPVEGAPSNLIIQVAGTEGQDPEKNVTLEQGRFSMAMDGNYVVDVTMEEFMLLVDEQNPG